MALTSKHRIRENLKTKDTETRKTETQKDEDLALQKNR